MTRVLRLAAALVLVLPLTLPAQQPGDRVLLESSNVRGVPVHPAPGDNSFVRWENGSEGVVQSMDQETGWYLVASGGADGWIVKKYLTVVSEEPVPSEGEEQDFYVVGTWNLEHFHEGATRGFPETLSGGPSYPPRTEDDYAFIAGVITSRILAKALILNEIAGDSPTRSDELDRLLGHLGSNWTYELTQSGGSMRVALLYDSTAVRKNVCVEFVVEEQVLDGKDIFDRDPLACHVTFLDGDGAPMNDLVIVGLHLASGQPNNDNHNRAMEVLRERLHEAIDEGKLPSGEPDVLIGGDLNASRYDSADEDFWEGYDSDGFDFATLAPTDGTEYPGTRLAGTPLFPRSQIDYLLASSASDGLVGAELVRPTGHVHEELLPADFTEFRRRASDHLPVTVRIRVTADHDGS